MKREVVFVCVFLIAFLIPFVASAEDDQVDLAYSCLTDEVNSTGCSSLGFEQRAFSLLALNECRDEVISSNQTISLGNDTQTCWPSGDCDVKETALALLGLSQSDYDTSSGEDWLLSNSKNAEGINWLIEVDSNSATTCTVDYDNPSSGNYENYGFFIADNKKVSSDDLGSCLSISDNGYFIGVDSNCYGVDFEISCDESFVTTTLFQKSGSSTLNVLDRLQSESAGGLAVESVDSLCFTDPSGNCDYEGSLWASEILLALGQDEELISPYIPYLVAFSEENSDLLPESFLYYLTGKFKQELTGNQVPQGYWRVSGDIYYDTALALLPLLYESSLTSDAKNWLLKVQDDNGCWDNGNLRNTAFILYSVWPRDYSTTPSQPSVVCGDGIIEGDEECDGSNLGSANTCEEVKGSNWEGDVTCYPPGSTYECQYDISECTSTDEPECTEETVEEDCSSGYDCVNGECKEPSGSDTECTIQTEEQDCNPGEECVSGFCAEVSDLNCVDEGFYCMSPADCEGNLLSSYSCSGISKCCSEPKPSLTCVSQGGKICSPDEECRYDSTIAAGDIYEGEVCCTSTCIESSAEPEEPSDEQCSSNGGTCRSSCLSDESANSVYECDLFGDQCCFEDTSGNNNGALLIWILVALIVLTVLGIVFREKIKDLVIKMKHKMKKKKGPKGPGGFRPLPGRMIPPPGSPRPGPRKILPPSHPRPSQRPPVNRKKPSKPNKDLDDVLKKLRDLGK